MMLDFGTAVAFAALKPQIEAEVIRKADVIALRNGWVLPSRTRNIEPWTAEVAQRILGLIKFSGGKVH